MPAEYDSESDNETGILPIQSENTEGTPACSRTQTLRFLPVSTFYYFFHTIYDIFHILLKVKELYPDIAVSSLPLNKLEHLIKNMDNSYSQHSFSMIKLSEGGIYYELSDTCPGP